MAGNLQLIATAIGAVAGEVTGIQNIETKPVLSAGRKLPAIFVTYDGFQEAPMTFGPTSLMVYNFQLTLYLALDQRDMGPQWDNLVDLSSEIIDTFRNHFRLDGTFPTSILFKALIKKGRPIIAKPRNPEAKPAWIGHRFDLEVSIEES